MPIPHIPGRLEFMANTMPLPPSKRGRVEAGFIDTQEVGFEEIPGRADAIEPETLIRVTVTRLQRNFVFLVHVDDIQALFIPNNPVLPDLEAGDWYFGSGVVSEYLLRQSSPTDSVLGVLYLKSDAQVRWTAEGSSSISNLKNTIRPVYEIRELGPIEFEAIMDNLNECDDG